MNVKKLKIKQTNISKDECINLKNKKTQLNQNRAFGRNLNNLNNGKLQKKHMINHSKNYLKAQSSSFYNLIKPYETQILERILKSQINFRVDKNYIKYHKILNIQSRIFFIKYLYKIHMKFNLKKTTLFLAVYYMDSYLQKQMDLDEISLLLVVQASLHIAMKYQQIYPPQLTLWAGNKYKQQIITFQAKILNCLDFKLAYFTVQHFYEYQNCQKKLNKNQQITARLLLDLTLFDIKSYQYRPSTLYYNYQKILKQQEDQNNDIMLNIKQIISKNSYIMQWILNINKFQINRQIFTKQNNFIPSKSL